jgi:hypothetical protein
MMGDWRVQFHKEMTEAVDKWFWSFYVPSNEFSETTLYGGLKVYLCGSEAVLKREFQRIHGESLDHIEGLAGWGAKHGELWTVAHFSGGKIIPNQYALGHELQHQINHVDKAVQNPDEAIGKGYY